MKKLTKILTILLVVASFATAWAAPAEGSVAPNKKLYDFNFVEMDYDAVFRSVSVIAGVDILVAPDVKGKISLKVTKKTWQETLDIICEINDLTWVIQDKYITIQRQSTYQAKQKKLADEEKQLVRYYNYAKRKSCSKYYIFYLTLDGRLPSDYSTGKMLECDKDYYCISYRDDILNWLSECQKEANGKPLVHGIITQYKDLVSTLTHQNMDMDTQIKLASKIAENSEYMILASIINDNFKHILHQMCEIKLNELCKRVAQNLSLNCKHYGQWGNKYSGVSFTKEKWRHFSVSFEFMKDNLDCFCFGVKYLVSIKEEKSDAEKATLSKCVQDEFEKDLNSEWWPWYSNEWWWPWYIQDKKYPNWTSEYAIKALYGGAMESHILDEIKKIADKVDIVERILSNNEQ